MKKITGKKLLAVFSAVILSAMLATGMAMSAMAQEIVDEGITITLNVSITKAEEGESALEITKDTTLIVDGDVTLTGAKGGAGIYVAEGVTLRIEGTGTLTAIGNAGVDDKSVGAAGIGGTAKNGNCGNIIIDGAKVKAYGYGRHGAGIGSGIGGVSGEIKIINGADVFAQGGHYVEGGPISSSWGKKEDEGGAGIGGGSARHDAIIGNILIDDSTVVAYGGQKAAGIGAGYHGGCGKIEIVNGSNVTATGGASSAGIGTSRAHDVGASPVHEKVNSAAIIIDGSTVNAIGGDAAAAIGTGFASNKPEIETTTTININNSNVTATGGDGGAGIGGGIGANTVAIEIEDSEIEAVAGSAADFEWFLDFFPYEHQHNASAIGSGANEGNAKYTGASVTIDEDSEINVTPAYGRAPIEKKTKDGAENSIKAEITVNAENVENAVAKIGDAYYTNIEVAVADLADGDVLDLCGNTFENVGISVSGIDVTVKNGKIIVDEAEVKYPFEVSRRGKLTIENVDIEASMTDRAIFVNGGELNFKSGNILVTKGEGNNKNQLSGIWMYSNSNVIINGGTITVDSLGANTKASAIYGNYNNTNVTLNDGKLSTSGGSYSYGIAVDGDVIIEGGEIVTNEKGYGYSWGGRYGYNYAIYNANGDVTISDGTITTNGPSGNIVNVGTGSSNSGNQKVSITGGTFKNNLNEAEMTTGGHSAPELVSEGSEFNVDVTITGGTFTGFAESLIRTDDDGVTSFVIKKGNFDFDPKLQDPCYVDDESTVIKTGDGFAVVEYADYESEEIKVMFVDADVNVPGEKLYNIVLKSKNDKLINRLNSVDLTFDLDGDAMAYEVIASNSEITVNPVNNLDDRYEFHYDGKTGVATDTSKEIVIGQIKITGYGTYALSVVDVDTNAVHTTTLNDNIVTDFIPNGAESNKGNLTYDDGVTGTIIVPTQALTININFPNSIENNAADYQAMAVKVTGADIAPIVIDLGSDAAATDLTIENKVDASYSVSFTDGAYVVVIENALTVNTAYTVEVSGAGYRTARYTVTMTENKTLNFWNNVKDNAVEVEEGKDTSAKTVTYLAGDIVKDNNINIYDLSAVVSYFGETMSTDEYNAYAKYDLNRDGKIDSRDVAYVLVSWNN